MIENIREKTTNRAGAGFLTRWLMPTQSAFCAGMPRQALVSDAGEKTTVARNPDLAHRTPAERLQRLEAMIAAHASVNERRCEETA